MLGLGLSMPVATSSSRFSQNQRLVPVSTNEFYVVAPHQTGAIGYRFIRNTPGSTPAASIDAPNPLWRLAGAVKLASVAGVTASTIAAAVSATAYWSYDEGAQDIAISVGSVFGGSYHGGVGSPSLNVIETIDRDGNAATFNQAGITVGGSIVEAWQFRIRHTYTITWPTGPRTLTVTDFRLTVDRDGNLTESCPTGAATLNSGDFGYIGSMLIAASAQYDQLRLNSANMILPMVAGRTIFGVGPTTPTDVTMSRSDNGDTVRCTTNVPTLTNFTSALFARGETIKDAALQRSKLYYRLPTNGGSWAAATSSRRMIFGSNLVSTPTRTSLISNGDFANGTTGWTTSQGSASVVSGALRMTRQAGTDNRTYQAITCVVGKTYMLSFDIDTAGNGSFYTLGITAGSNTGALISAFSPVAGTNRHLFVATQTTHYLMLGQALGTAGQVINYDNAAVWQLD